MKKKILFLLIAVSLICLMAISISAERYTPTFGAVTTVGGIAEPTILDTTSRVVMTDGTTYPAYYILNDSTSFSPNFNKLNNALKALGQEAAYDRGTVIALEIPEGTINLPSCWSAGGFFQGDHYIETIEYVRLPSTLETMGEAAIYQITTLKVIDNFENTKVVNIPTRLHGLSSLQYIHLPNTVKTIPGGAFRDCTSLEYVILGASIEEINTQAFLYAGNNSGKSSLKVYVSDTLLTVYNAYGDGPLQGSNSVVELYYTGTLTDVGMQQMITGTGIKKGASKWAFVDASAEGFDKDTVYTTNTFIYNYNACDAFYNGKHVMEDASGCQVKCKNCGLAQEKDNPVHTNTVTMQKTEKGYFDTIIASTVCSSCGKVEKEESIAPLFTHLGYSVSTYGDGYAMVQGYYVNKAAVDAYKCYAPNFKFGVIAAINATEGSVSPKVDDANVIAAPLDNLNHDYFDIKISGIPAEKCDSLVVFCAYVIENDTIYYLDNNVTSLSVTGFSYNQVSQMK